MNINRRKFLQLLAVAGAAGSEARTSGLHPVITRCTLLVLAILAWFAFSPVLAQERGETLSLDHALAERVTPHIYVMHGPRGLPNRENAGFMSNPAFVITNAGVVVVDPGASARIGLQLVKVIRSVTRLPVVAVFNTHIHGDHWLGNDGIRRVFPDAPIYAHRNMVARRDSGEGEGWLRSINQMTDGATAGTRVIWPETSVVDGQIFTIGDIQFRVHETGIAHTDTDLLIEVINDKAIFLGDVVVHRSWPAVRPQDALLRGYMNAIQRVLEMPVQTFIPGHGPTGDRQVALEQLQMMEKLYGAVQRHYRQGETDFEMVDAISHDLAEYREWYWYEGLGRLISYVYLEVEAESFR